MDKAVAGELFVRLRLVSPIELFQKSRRDLPAAVVFFKADTDRNCGF